MYYSEPKPDFSEENVFSTSNQINFDTGLTTFINKKKIEYVGWVGLV